jgi:hypothetical protein
MPTAAAHRQSLKQRREEFGTTRRSVSAVVGAIISVVGLLAFIAAALQG